MISLEMARKLKDAGLKWEPEMGDVYYGRGTLFDWDFALLKEEQKTKGIVWAPRLHQILAEIVAQGYGYNLSSPFRDGKYDCMVWEDGCGPRKIITANTPEQAAAEALLWILQRERDAE